jgi:hypothetical protein
LPPVIRSTIFGIELLGERRRVHQIAEHDGELAALCISVPSIIGHRARGCFDTRHRLS